MKLELFEALKPVCPRCLHVEGKVSPLVVGSRNEMRAGHLWQGTLHCSNRDCWLEFPVIDGVPLLVPDPRNTLATMKSDVLSRDDLAPLISGLLGDALGPGAELDAARQNLSLYAYAHYADWAGAEAAQIPPILSGALGAVETGTTAVDLGTSVGRTAFELSALGCGTVLGVDLNFSMLRLAQTLLLEGSARVPLRRVGIVYDEMVITLPDHLDASNVDFWAADCHALPFEDAGFGLVAALNLIDCVASPTQLISEIARLTSVGSQAVLSTPYDWSGTATELAQWLGGHSQRGPWDGESEPVLRATLAQAGLVVEHEVDRVPWKLRLHARAEMTYALDVLRAVRMAGTST